MMTYYLALLWRAVCEALAAVVCVLLYVALTTKSTKQSSEDFARELKNKDDNECKEGK